jgi:hypothetical protein
VRRSDRLNRHSNVTFFEGSINDVASTQDKPPSKTSSTNTFAFGAKTKAEATAQIEQLKKEGKLPTLDQWLAAVAKVRKEFQSQILAARAEGPEPEEEEEDEEI